MSTSLSARLYASLSTGTLEQKKETGDKGLQLEGGVRRAEGARQNFFFFLDVGSISCKLEWDQDPGVVVRLVLYGAGVNLDLLDWGGLDNAALSRKNKSRVVNPFFFIFTYHRGNSGEAPC